MKCKVFKYIILILSYRSFLVENTLISLTEYTDRISKNIHKMVKKNILTSRGSCKSYLVELRAWSKLGHQGTSNWVF